MLHRAAAETGARYCLRGYPADAVRELAFDRDLHIGQFDEASDEARKCGQTGVDMKQDWQLVYRVDD